MLLELTHRADGDIRIITVTGDVDVYTAPRLREMTMELANVHECRWQVIDLDGCRFLDATGVAVIVGALKRVRAVNGGLAIVCTYEPIAKVFRITGMDKLFVLHQTAADAIAALRAQVGADAC